MTEKTAVPEYCRGGKKIRAYQCGICDRLDVDDASDKRFCRAGYWPVAVTLTVAGKHSNR